MNSKKIILAATVGVAFCSGCAAAPITPYNDIQQGRKIIFPEVSGEYVDKKGNVLDLINMSVRCHSMYGAIEGNLTTEPADYQRVNDEGNMARFTLDGKGWNEAHFNIINGRKFRNFHFVFTVTKVLPDNSRDPVDLVCETPEPRGDKGEVIRKKL